MEKQGYLHNLLPKESLIVNRTYQLKGGSSINSNDSSPLGVSLLRGTTETSRAETPGGQLIVV